MNTSPIVPRILELRRKLKFGVVPAMATPIHEDDRTVAINFVHRLVDFLVNSGVSGLFVGGTTGEGIILDAQERMQLHEEVVDAVSGKIPTLIHVGANSTAQAAKLAEHASDIGADAIVAVTPYFYPVQDDSAAAYFEALSEAAPDVPLIAYDIPQFAVNQVSVSLFQRMIETIPSFAGIKCSSPDAQKIRKLVDISQGRAMVLAGNESIALGSLALGVDGLISGLATAIPEPFVSLVRHFSSGELRLAQEDQVRINKMLDILPAGRRIGAIKQILNERGVPVGRTIPPRTMPDDTWEGWSRLKQELD